jgi:hypothetical protein
VLESQQVKYIFRLERHLQLLKHPRTVDPLVEILKSLNVAIYPATASLDVASLDVASFDVVSFDIASFDMAALCVAALDEASLDIASLDVAARDEAPRDEASLFFRYSFFT